MVDTGAIVIPIVIIASYRSSQFCIFFQPLPSPIFGHHVVNLKLHSFFLVLVTSSDTIIVGKSNPLPPLRYRESLLASPHRIDH